MTGNHIASNDDGQVGIQNRELPVLNSSKPPPPKRNVATDLKRLLGNDIVFVKCHKGTKQAAVAWKDLSIEHMTAKYLRSLETVNVAVILGEKSGHLCAIDIDNPECVGPLLAANPALVDTFQTRGAPGHLTLWLRFTGDYPQRTKKFLNDNGEFRSNGGYSLAYGIHPGTHKPYERVVEKPVVEIEYASIKWPECLMPGQSNRQATPENAAIPSKTTVGTDDAEGEFTEGCPPHAIGGGVRLGGVGGCGVMVSSEALILWKQQIERAIGVVLNMPEGNNGKSFLVCRTVLEIRNEDNLHEMPDDARRYLCHHWYDRLKAANKANPQRTKTHYYKDMSDSIRNVTRTSATDKPKLLQQACILAQTTPLPPEAAAFEGDSTMQRFIALLHGMHIASEKGDWFMSKNKAAEILCLNETEKRNLSDNFDVLVNDGILELIKPGDKATRQASIYRYVDR